MSCLLISADVSALLAVSIHRLTQHSYSVSSFSKSHKPISALDKAILGYKLSAMLLISNNTHNSYNTQMLAFQKLPEQVVILQIKLKLEHLVCKHSNALILTGSNFSGSALEFKALGMFLGTRVGLTSLQMDSVYISRSSALIMLESFSGCCSVKMRDLRRVLFYNNGIGLERKCLDILVRLLLMFPCLEQVSLIRNSLTDEDSGSVSALLSAPQIRRVSLACNPITSHQHQ
jgi:hypothetical protein